MLGVLDRFVITLQQHTCDGYSTYGSEYSVVYNSRDAGLCLTIRIVLYRRVHVALSSYLKVPISLN